MLTSTKFPIRGYTISGIMIKGEEVERYNRKYVNNKNFIFPNKKQINTIKFKSRKAKCNTYCLLAIVVDDFPIPAPGI